MKQPSRFDFIISQIKRVYYVARNKLFLLLFKNIMSQGIKTEAMIETYDFFNEFLLLTLKEEKFWDDDIGDIYYPDDWEEEEYADIHEKVYEYEESKELMKELKGNENE